MSTIYVILAAFVVLAATAAAFLAGLITGTSRGEQRAAAACDIAHRGDQRPAIIWPADLKHGLDHYEIRAVSTGACNLTVPVRAPQQTSVDAFEVYRDITEQIVKPQGKHAYQDA